MADTKNQRGKIGAALYKKRFIFPNLVTIGNIFCGFLAIVYASAGQFDKAIFAVFVAIILDGLDGRVARKLNAASPFGVQFDSLSDLVSFGVAPATIMYEWCFREQADEFGVLICFIYVLCDAARLARFNVSQDAGKDFNGLPSPAAAAMVVSIINLFPSIDAPQMSVFFGTVYMLVVSALMISDIIYPSGKGIKFKDPLKFTLLLGSAIAFLWYTPRLTVFLISTAYCLSGPLLYIPTAKKKFKEILKKI